METIFLITVWQDLSKFSKPTTNYCIETSVSEFDLGKTSGLHTRIYTLIFLKFFLIIVLFQKLFPYLTLKILLIV